MNEIKYNAIDCAKYKSNHYNYVEGTIKTPIYRDPRFAVHGFLLPNLRNYNKGLSKKPRLTVWRVPRITVQVYLSTGGTVNRGNTVG